MPYTDQLLPFASGSETSRAGAVRMQPHYTAQERRVLTLLRDCGDRGCTQLEASYLLQLGRPSCCARFRGLELAGLLVKTDMRREACTVYRLVELAR